MPLKFECPSCHKDIVVQYLSRGETARCRFCKEEVTVPDTAEVLTGEEVEEYAEKVRKDEGLPQRLPGFDKAGWLNPGQRRKLTFLKIIAWIVLIGGCFIGLIGMITAFAADTPEGAGENFGFSLFYIFQAVAIFALFQAVASIAENMILIQKHLMRDNDKPAEAQPENKV